MMHAQAMAPWHATEWFFFFLANAIIFYFCYKGVVADVRAWWGKRGGRAAGPRDPGERRAPGP